VNLVCRSEGERVSKHVFALMVRGAVSKYYATQPILWGKLFTHTHTHTLTHISHAQRHSFPPYGTISSIVRLNRCTLDTRERTPRVSLTILWSVCALPAWSPDLYNVCMSVWASVRAFVCASVSLYVCARVHACGCLSACIAL
jgi:hypothetical protein